MTRETRIELNRARRLYKDGKRSEAYEIYSRRYHENPENLKHWDKIRYCWCIYYLFIRNSTDASEIMEYAEFVTDLVAQEDLNEKPVCVYTQCVFKVIMTIKGNDDWDHMFYWLDKLNPDLLSEIQNTSGDVTYPSKREEYYKFLSKACLECRDYEECIRVSGEALQKIDVEFAFDGKIWHYWRIAKSYMALGYHEDAWEYFTKVLKVKRDWFILKDMAECCHEIAEDGEALEYAKEAVLSDADITSKVNLYLVVYKILQQHDEAMALKHAQLLALKLESGAQVPEEIDDLNIDEESLNIDELEEEIRSYWVSFKTQ